jgi:hypothetical protein
VPTGCFITDSASSCYNLSFYASDCDQWNMTSYYFGTYVASMCGYVNSLESIAKVTASSLDQCKVDTNTIAFQRDSYLNERNTCLVVAAGVDKNRQEWIAYAKGRDAMIKKLQRACGAKCRKIK